MHARLTSARLAPKKANIMAKMVRGRTVPDAIELLRNTGKKSARLFEGVLQSAIANAQHTFKQDAQTMVLKTVIVNQGTSLRRGVPMARGRVRPIRKFLCHISITLGFPREGVSQGEIGQMKRMKRMKKTKRSDASSPQTDAKKIPSVAIATSKNGKASSLSSFSSSSSSSS